LQLVVQVDSGGGSVYDLLTVGGAGDGRLDLITALGAALHRLVLGVGTAQTLDLFVDLRLRDRYFGLGLDVEFVDVA